MEAKVRCYPDVKVRRKSFKGVKRITVPNQSMSLREICQRFIRREELPLSKDGFYTTEHGDLEKLAKADFTVRAERLREVKAKVAAYQKAEDEKKAAAVKAAKDAEKQQIIDEYLKANPPAVGKPA